MRYLDPLDTLEALRGFGSLGPFRGQRGLRPRESFVGNMPCGHPGPLDCADHWDSGLLSA